MIEYERWKDAEQANYHFTLSDLCDFIAIYGWDQVITDLNDYYNKRLEQNAKQID